MRRTEAALANAMIGMREAVDKETDMLHEAVWRKVTDNDAEIRENLRYVLAGSVRDRVIGVGLLGVGIIFAAVGSVLSAS